MKTLWKQGNASLPYKRHVYIFFPETALLSENISRSTFHPDVYIHIYIDYKNERLKAGKYNAEIE